MIYLFRALIVMLIAYGLVGGIDMHEEQRLSLEGYVNDRATVLTVERQ